MKTFILQIIILLFHSTLIFSQSFSFKKYTSVEGLRPVVLNKILQDRRGIIWFGGIGGISTYDGCKFKYVFENLNEKLTIKDIIEDSKGNIWVATEENGVAIINNNYNLISWLSVDNKKLISNSVNTLLLDKEKNVWLGTNQGIIIIHRDNPIKIINKENGLLRNSVNNMIMDSSGAVWVSDGGLAKITFEQGKLKSFERIHKIPLISLAIGKDNSILFGTIDLVGDKRMGVYRYKNSEQKKILEPENFKDPIKPMSIYESDEGVVWVGTTRGLFLINHDKIIRIRNKNGLINENISSIIKDRENNLWISTSNGALKLTNRYFINFTENDGLFSSSMLTGLIDSDNNFWFGGWSGLYKVNPNFNLTAHEICYIKTPQVHSLIEDDKGLIYIGSFPKFYIINQKEFNEFRVKKNSSDVFVKTLIKDKSGNIYAGLTGEIIIIKNQKIIKSYNSNFGIKNSSFVSMAIDDKERLWFCQESRGLGLIINDSLRYFTTEDGLPVDEINFIFIDSKKRIWLGTSVGLVHFSPENNEFKKITFANKRTINVRCLNEDSKGNLWIGSDLGVYQWNDSVICCFNSRDGLAGDIINAILIDKNDNLAFATNSGISFLKFFDKNRGFPIPKIWIEFVSERNEDSIIYNTNSLDYQHNSVSFRLFSPSFYDERSMEFSYMLEGLENKWSTPSSQVIIRYSHLESGEYSLLAKAKNRNSQWSNIAVYNFEILPPYWQTWWFRLLLISIIILLGASIYKRRIAQLQREAQTQQRFSKMLIESQEAERKRIASELHDGLGQELLTIINRAKISLKKPESYPAEKQLKEISDAALNSIEEVRRIARNLHPYQLDSLGLTNILKGLIEKFKETSDMMVEYSIDNVDHILAVEKELNIYRILQECINNIIKHSNATEVKIYIKKIADEISILISDNGIGIPYQLQQEIFNKNSGFGLLGVRERIKYLNGTLMLESFEGKGTLINIIIPLGRNE